MANLLALLNPAPQAEQSPPAPGTQLTDARGVASNQKDDHHDMRPANIFTGGSPRPPSLTSPLDALAEAATSSAPLPSPSRPTHTSISHDVHYQSLPTPSSRPTSSHASPPKPFELPRMPQQSSIGQFSPGLQQYHHSSSDEVRARRLSNIANTSAEALPPLRKSVTDENLPPPTGLPAIEPHTENDIIAKGSVVASSIPISPSFEPTRPIPEPLSPVTSQIQEPPPSHVYSSHSPDILEEQSEQVQVKTEVPEIPSELSKAVERTRAPVAQMSAGPFAQHTTMTEVPAAPKSVANLKNEAANDPSHIPVPIEASTPKASAKPKQAPSKKRAAPKKGTASAVKPTNKKRKTENGSVASSPALPRTGTPASSRASKTPAPKGGKQGSVTPARSSSVANAKEEDEDEEMDEGDSSELFCICRKPDDHTWMIGCDGPCEDWFHGRCVNMNERDGNLIDKYFCPNCTSAGVGQTLWKPMCRLSTCRNPARATGSKFSKYCSDEHGIEFMRLHALKGEPDELQKPTVPQPTTGRRKSRKDNYTDHVGNNSSDHLLYEYTDQEDDSHLRGGVLRPAELKTLASSTNSISEFRSLGNEGVLSPPQTVSPTDETTKPIYTPAESAQLEAIATKTEELKHRKHLLDDRDSFLDMVKARAKTALDELKKKEKGAGLCGYDPRLMFTDQEFAAWRSSPEGAEALRTGQLPTSASPETTDTGPAETDVAMSNGIVKEDATTTTTTTTAAAATGKEGGEGAMCTKKRCKRHEQWQKLQTQEAALEKDIVRQEMRRLIAEEKGVKERAAIRGLEGG